MDNLSMLSF